MNNMGSYRQSSGPARVLIVEDTLVVARHIEQMLNLAGFEVVDTVASGERAVPIAATAVPDLVLMDINLAGKMDGIEAAEQIRADQDIPVVYLTAYADRTTLQRAKATHPHGYLIKPFQERELLVAIEIALEKHQLERDLRASENKYRMLVEQASDGIFIADQNWNYQEVNAQGCLLLGYAREEILGMNVRDVLVPDDPMPFRVKELLSGQPVRSERWLLRKDGSRVPVEISAQVLSDGRSMAIVRDMSERKKAEREMRVLSNAVAQAADSIIITDATGVIEYVNPAFEAITGFKADEARGQTPNILKSGEQPESFYQDLWETVLSGETFRASFTNRHKSGEIFYEDRTITPVFEDGEIQHIVSTSRDITEKTHMQQQLQAIYDLGQRLLLLHDQKQIIAEVLQTASHYLGVPLVGCGIVNKSENTLVFQYRLLEGELYAVNKRFSLADEQGLTVGVVKNGMAVNVPDTAQNDRYIPVTGHPYRAELCVPMMVENRIFGVLNAESPTVGHFKDSDQTLLQILANQAATALENARLHEQMARRASELAMLNKAFRSMTYRLDMSHVLNQVIGEVNGLLQAKMSSILLLNEDGTALEFVAVAGPSSSQLLGQQLQSDQGLAGYVAHTGEPIVVGDVNEDSRFLAEMNQMLSLNVRSLLAVPLQYQERTIGVIEVVSQTPAAFGEADVDLLTALANTASIAIENARLYESALARQREIELVQKASLSLTASLELPLVLDEIAQAALRLSQGESVHIFLYEQGNLHFATAVDMNGKLARATPDLADLVLFRDHFVTVEDKWSLVDGAIDLLPPMGNDLSLPLKIGVRLVGVMIVAHAAGRLPRAGMRLGLELLADQAAIAIENARLYKREQEQLRKLKRSQEQLIQAEKMGAVGRLTASIAHEINNPLQSIQGCLTLTREELATVGESERLSRYLDIVEAEIERIATIVRRVRDFYRPAQSGMDRVSVSSALEDVIALTAKQMQHSQIQVERTGQIGLPRILANETQLKQVFLNLIINAVDAMPNGGSLTIETRVITPEGVDEAAGEMLEVRFVDTGVGITPELVGNLFEPFFTTKNQGSGLGLYICYNIVEAHGGKIDIVGVETGGVVATVVLPIDKENESS